MSANRRNFLKTLSALPLAVLGRQAEASVSAPPPARRLLLNRFSIAGFQYYDGQALMPRPGEAMIRDTGFEGCYEEIATIDAREFAACDTEGSARRDYRPTGPPKLYCGCRLNLLVEPDNPYDPFAVSIYLGETKLGYVPRSDNKHISRLLDQDAKLECRVIEVNPDAWVWNMVRVEVWLILHE